MSMCAWIQAFTLYYYYNRTNFLNSLPRALSNDNQFQRGHRKTAMSHVTTMQYNIEIMYIVIMLYFMNCIYC